MVSAPNPSVGRIDETSFPIVRKGFDPREVIKYLRGVEESFQDLETWTQTLRHQLEEAERELSSAVGAEAGAVDTAMVAVFDAKDRIIERTTLEADRLMETTQIEARSIKDEAERLLSSAQSQAGRLKDALVDGDEGGIAAARLKAAEAEAARIIAAAGAKAAELEVSQPVDTSELESRIALLESDLEVATFEATKVSTERDRLFAELARAREDSKDGGSAAETEEMIAEAERKVARLVAGASESAARAREESDAYISDSRAEFEEESTRRRAELDAAISEADAELRRVQLAAAESTGQTRAAIADAGVKADAVRSAAEKAADLLLAEARSESGRLKDEAAAAIADAKGLAEEAVAAARLEAEEQAASIVAEAA